VVAKGLAALAAVDPVVLLAVVLKIKAVGLVESHNKRHQIQKSSRIDEQRD
jgi:hypothetical protein